MSLYEYAGKDTALIADQRQQGYMGQRAAQEARLAEFWHGEYEPLAPGPKTWVTPETDTCVCPNGLDDMDILVEVRGEAYTMHIDDYIDDTTYFPRHWRNKTKDAIYAAATMEQLAQVAELAKKRSCFNALLRHFEIRGMQIRRGGRKEARVEPERKLDPRALAQQAGVDAIAVANGNGGYAFALVWGHDRRDERMSLHVPKEMWMAALAMQPRVGKIRGKQYVIFE